MGPRYEEGPADSGSRGDRASDTKLNRPRQLDSLPTRKAAAAQQHGLR